MAKTGHHMYSPLTPPDPVWCAEKDTSPLWKSSPLNPAAVKLRESIGQMLYKASKQVTAEDTEFQEGQTGGGQGHTEPRASAGPGQQDELSFPSSQETASDERVPVVLLWV